MFIGTCVPYSKRACLNASYNLGLELGVKGREFEGNHAIKGCHAEGGFAHYGIGAQGGIVENEHRTVLVAPKHRPNGFDCGKGSTIVDTLG